MKVVILGCGSAYGAPQSFNQWRRMNPNDKRNQRSRSSIYLEEAGKKFIVDTGPEFRLQVNENNIDDVDAVFITHGHYDHTAGFPELTRASGNLEHKISVWFSEETEKSLRENYRFIFEGKEPESVGLCFHRLPCCGEFEAEGVVFQTFQVKHHHWHCSAFRCKNFAYVTDWEQIPPEGMSILSGVETLLIECNNGLYPEKNGHSDLEKVKQIAAQIKPKRVILTHLSARVDFEETQKELPKNFELACDGMILNI